MYEECHVLAFKVFTQTKRIEYMKKTLASEQFILTTWQFVELEYSPKTRFKTTEKNIVSWREKAKQTSLLDGIRQASMKMSPKIK
jgi:hypothetical protein